jgi:hypothetical protein
MYPEDLSGPETAQEQPGFDDGISIEDISKPLAGDLYDSNIDDFFEPVDEPDWGVKTAENPSDSIEVDFGWGFDFDLPVAPEGPSNPLPTEPTNTGVVPPWLQEPSGPFSDSVGELGIDRDGNGIEDRWEEISPTVSEEKDPIGDSLSPDTPEEPTPGGYDDMLGISKEDIEGPSSDTDGPGIDQDGMPENTGINPDMSGENYTYDEGAYEDAQDAFEDLQDALQDGDEEDRAEALEELRDYLNGFDKDNEDRENDSHNPGDQEDEHHENQRPDMSDEDYTYDEDAYEDAEGALKDLQHALKHGDEEDRTKALEELQGYLNGFNKDNEQEEDYTYDEDAYKDAEGALKDLQHALKHGDEQERAEALEKLQGYLGGFGKGDEEEDRDGTETQDGKIPTTRRTLMATAFVSFSRTPTATALRTIRTRTTIATAILISRTPTATAFLTFTRTPTATPRRFRTPWIIRSRRTRPTLPEPPSADRPRCCRSGSRCRSRRRSWWPRRGPR